jgi:hypothetical protein
MLIVVMLSVVVLNVVAPKKFVLGRRIGHLAELTLLKKSQGSEKETEAIQMESKARFKCYKTFFFFVIDERGK